MELFYVFIAFSFTLIIITAIVNIIVGYLKSDQPNINTDINTDYDYEVYLKELKHQENRKKKA